MAFDPLLEERPRKGAAVHEIGQDLSSLSLGELEERVTELLAEIERLKAETLRKQATAAAASAFFKS